MIGTCSPCLRLLLSKAQESSFDPPYGVFCIGAGRLSVMKRLRKHRMFTVSDPTFPWCQERRKSMDADQCRAAIAGMADDSLHEAVDALCRARDHAMQLKVNARLPERAAFGAIARDLDYSLSTIRRYTPAASADKKKQADEAMAAALGNLIRSGPRGAVG